MKLNPQTVFYVPAFQGVFINPLAAHGYRRSIGGLCAACTWPKWHAVHQLRGRRYPYLHARVRLLSVPMRYRGFLRPGIECEVTQGLKWYHAEYGLGALDGAAILTVRHRTQYFRVAARQLLVLE